MEQHRREFEDFYELYDDGTDPLLSSITAPIPLSALPRETWIRRALRGIGNFFAAIIHKINQLLALALAVLLLLLFTRFILLFFGLTLSDFVHWVFWLTAPPVAPFENLLPTLPYDGYSIDPPTLIAIVIYTLAVTIVRQFLKILIQRPF
jgi:uncharacterized protein YggT (Ycf19 family)